MGMLHITQKLILPVRLSLKGTTQGEGGHKICGWGKSMLSVVSYLAWEEGLQWDWHEVIARTGVRGWTRQCAPWHMSPMIDWLILIFEPTFWLSLYNCKIIYYSSSFDFLMRTISSASLRLFRHSFIWISNFSYSKFFKMFSKTTVNSLRGISRLIWLLSVMVFYFWSYIALL